MKEVGMVLTGDDSEVLSFMFDMELGKDEQVKYCTESFNSGEVMTFIGDQFDAYITNLAYEHIDDIAKTLGMRHDAFNLNVFKDYEKERFELTKCENGIITKRIFE